MRVLPLCIGMQVCVITHCAAPRDGMVSLGVRDSGRCKQARLTHEGCRYVVRVPP